MKEWSNWKIALQYKVIPFALIALILFAVFMLAVFMQQ